MNKLLIFDLYGTLVSMNDPLNPFKIFFQQLKLTSAELVLAKELVLSKPFKGFEELAHTLAKPKPQNIDLLNDYVRREIDSTALFPDTWEAIKNLSQHYDLYILSNIATPYKEPVFRLGIDQFFKKMFFSCDLGLRKPDKNLFNNIMKELCINPESVTMIGDSITSDIESAKSVGMNAIYVNRNRKEMIFEKQIFSLAELVKMLE